MCDIGNYRSSCSDVQDGHCISCSNKPMYSSYVGAGTPFNANNCAFQCNQGFFVTNGSCQPCSTQLCESGRYRSQCNSQEDGQCVLCTNGPLSGKFSLVDCFCDRHAMFFYCFVSLFSVNFLYLLLSMRSPPRFFRIHIRRDSV
jgi:hypothetical protein